MYCDVKESNGTRSVVGLGQIYSHKTARTMNLAAFLIIRYVLGC